ncbi:unnamed protein product [Rodentolepis nana]|uniref:Fascin-like domain-containing protein n=1 Tax=Rodentolepis nana TaxID=102285 RepID=A0A3P7VHT4_RODNA|nr:unnamed protein product [Rodentolepis nana]
MPNSPKFLLWLQQLPLPAASVQSSCGKEEVARLSRVALRTQSGRYLHSSGKLVGSIDEATLFAVSFKPATSQKLMFQDEKGQYLTVGAGGVLLVKSGLREPRREEVFAIDPPSIQVRLWAFNNKFACNKHGLTFSTTMGETDEEKETVYQLEYLGGGRGLNMSAIANTSTTPSADCSPAVFNFDGTDESRSYLTTGLWRLRAQDGRLWRIPSSGSADLAPQDCKDPSTQFEILYISSYQEEEDGGTKTKINPYGGIVIRTLEGRSTAVKPLGALGATERLADTSGWTPTPPEVLHLLPLINRTSVAIYSPLACAYLAPITPHSSNARRTSFGASSAVDCTSCVPQQWFIRNLVNGTVQFFTKMDSGWMILYATGQGNLALAESNAGPDEIGDNQGASLETEFVICMTDDKFALLRCLKQVGGQRKASYLTANLQGNIKLDGSGVITPGYIWQL